MKNIFRKLLAGFLCVEMLLCSKSIDVLASEIVDNDLSENNFDNAQELATWTYVENDEEDMSSQELTNDGAADYGYYKPYPEATYELYYKIKDDGTIEIISPYAKKEDRCGVLEIPGTIDGKKVTSISSQAFNSNEGFTGELNIPNSITYIGERAFYGCTGLTGNLVIPDSVTEIGEGAFGFCTGFKGYLKISDNITIIPKSAFLDGNFTGQLEIPDNVTLISDGAFQSCEKFTGELTIPQHVTEIGQSAFRNCTGFTGDLTIPEGVTKIGDGAFQNCSGFNGKLTVPSSVTTMGSVAFNNCSGISEIDNKSSESIKLPLADGQIWLDENGNETKEISNGIAMLKSNSSDEPEDDCEFEYRELDDGTICITGYKGEAKGDLIIPDKIDGKKVTTIGSFAFYNDHFNGKLILPEGIVNIEGQAFFGCDGFTGDLIIPDSVENIGQAAFSCSGFNGKLIIGKSVKSIGLGAFNQCEGFTGSLVIPNGVTSIGQASFNDCTGFTGNLTIPNSVKEIGMAAFQRCTGFTGCLTIPSSVETIKQNAFKECSGFSKITNNSSSVIALPLADGQVWVREGTGEELSQISNGNAIIKGNTETSYTIKYDANGATSGTAPVDPNSPYNKGANVKVLGQGNLKKDGYYFKGWCINSDGKDDPHIKGDEIFKEGDSFYIQKDTKFYAIWEFDRWGFVNSQDNFGKEENGYQISALDYIKLMSNLSDVERVYITGVKETVLHKWDGSCYGMSTTTALINKGKYRIEDYGFGDKSVLYEIEKADDNCIYDYNLKAAVADSPWGSAGKAESVINFFHLQQFLPENQAFVKGNHLNNSLTRLNDIKNKAKLDNPVVIFLTSKKNKRFGHVVLGIGYKDLNNNASYPGYTHCILTYDPNNPKETNQDASKSNIYFNDAGDWYFDGPPFNIKPGDGYYICGTDDLSLEAPVSYKNGTYNRLATMPKIMLSLLDYELVWSGGKVSFNNDEVINNTTDYEFLVLPEYVGDTSSERVRVFLPDSDNYIVKGDKIDHEILTEDCLIWAKAEQGGEALLNVSGDANISSDISGDMSLEVANNNASESVPAHVIIEASDVKQLSEKKEAGGIVVDADNLSTLKITTDDNSIVCNPTEDKVLVKEENGEINVYEDEDRDGNYEKEIEAEDVKDKTVTIVVGQKINLKETCFSNVTDTISRYVVDNKSLASVSKGMLTGKKAGTVKVTAQKQTGKNQYENVGEATVTILGKPLLKFTKPMTYSGQTINATDFFLADDIKALGATYWESSKPSVVKVTDRKTGALEATRSGTAKITAYFGEKGAAGTLKVSATLAVKVPSFQKNEYTMPTGGKLTLVMKNVNAASNPDWVTERSGIISATPQTDKKGNKTGKVILEGLAYGDTKLIATIDDQEYECTVHVVKPIINKTTMELKVGKTGTLSLKNTKLKKKDIVWKTDNPLIATVDANGKVKAESEGETVIYTEAGGVRNECTIKVNK